MNEGLLAYYQQATIVHQFTGLIGKVTLAVVLGAVAGGNRTPGHAILTSVLGVHLLIAAWLGFSIGSDDGIGTMVGRAWLPLSVIAFVCGACLLGSLAAPEGEWRTRHAHPAVHWLAWGLIVWAFLFPVFRGFGFKSILFSPMGVLPQPTLLVACALVMLSMPHAHRLIAWSAALGAIAMGIVDILAGVQSSWVLILAGLGAMTPLIKSQIAVGSIIEDDIPKVDVIKKARAQREMKEKTSDKKQWKLK